MASEGYDEEFVDTPPEYLNCIICHLVLREPLQLMQCGHHYCSACFKRIQGYSSHFNTQLSCPIDRQVIDQTKVTKDKFVERLVLDLKVKCSFKNNGCTWVGELRNIEAHRDGCAHALKEDSLKESQCSGGEAGVLSTELLKEIFVRLKQCEDSLAEKDKDLAFVKFQLKETKEKLQQRDEEVKDLKQKWLNSEEVLKLHTEDVELLKKEVEGLQQKILQFENEKTVESKQEMIDVCVSNKEEIDEPHEPREESVDQIGDNDEENKEVKKKKKKAHETQNNASQFDIAGENDQSNEAAGTRARTKHTCASQSDISGKNELINESAGAGAVEDIDSLMPTLTIAPQNQRNEFIWRTNVKEWLTDRWNFSPNFSPAFDCCANYQSCNLVIWVFPGFPCSNPMIRFNLETNRGNAIYNFVVELLAGNRSNRGSGKTICSYKFKSNCHQYDYELSCLAGHVYKPFIFNDILTIKCIWTCQHFADDDEDFIL